MNIEHRTHNIDCIRNVQYVNIRFGNVFANLRFVKMFSESEFS